ncbi:hypothetical protein SNE40_009219 [Patella caerulea]|uniref:Uncharacterized protein n=1 Tax=Patella caerulea TaxID=87958 RepID=A0AAN8PXZ3_PATCE
MHAPANIQTFASDHDYLEESDENLFVKEIGHTSIDGKKISSIAKSTVLQSSDKKLLEIRCLWICKLTERTDSDKYVFDLTEQKKWQ